MPLLRKNYKKITIKSTDPSPVSNEEHPRKSGSIARQGPVRNGSTYHPVASRTPIKPATSKPSVQYTSVFEDSEDDVVLDSEESKKQATPCLTVSTCVSSSSSSAPASRPIRNESSEEMEVDVEGDDGDDGRTGKVVQSIGGRGDNRQSITKAKSTAPPKRISIEDSSSEDEFVGKKPLPPRPVGKKTSVVSDRPQSRNERIVRNDVNEDANARARASKSPVDGRRSSLSRHGARSSSSASSAALSESQLSNRASIYDPNDPDWLKFRNSVKNNPANAHISLSSDLLESSNGSALLGKLIYRSTSNTDADTDTTDEKKLLENCGLTIIKALLHLTFENDNSSNTMVDLGNMLFTEIRHLSTSVLYNIVEHCLDYMKNDKDREGSLPSKWIEIFGQIIVVMITRGDIKHETDVLNWEEFKEYIITELCSPRVNWTADTTASLLAIIKEIPNIKLEELRQITLRVRSGLMALKASALPPIVHQLILVAGARIPSELLALCSEYFEGVDFGDLESMEVKRKRNALGTVVFHFIEAAISCDPLVKAVNKVVKASFFDFGKVMNPFMLSVVIGLTTFEHARSTIVDLLRNSIMKSFHSLHISEMSYWYQNKIGDAKEVVTECFKAILETKSSELEYMCAGLLELGMSLLSAESYQQKYPNTLERCHKLGLYLITSIIKSCPNQLPTMMSKLLAASSSSLVHAECLATCLEMRTRQIIHPSVIGKTCEIINQLPFVESSAAAMIVKALSPALNLSYVLLDALMLNLRKSIWKSVNAKRTAAKIMIRLLSNSRVAGDPPGSQYSESQRFYNDSQNIPNVPAQSFDNQPLCLELVVLAKRCFTQQSEIKEELYLGFHSIVRKNPGLCELICCHLYTHAAQYLSEDLDTSDNHSTPTILLGKVVYLPVTTNTIMYTSPVTIMEELGFLVQCLSFVVHKSYQAFHSVDDGPPPPVKSLEKLLLKWMKAVLKVTPETIEIAAADVVAGAGGSRPVDYVRYVELVLTIQVLQVIEALIEYLNLENKPNKSKIVQKLFMLRGSIEPLLTKEKEKVANKKGKGEKSKGKSKTAQKNGKDKDESVDDANGTGADDASETSENQQPAVKFKKPDAPKRLFYFHILTLENTLDLLRKLQKTGEDQGVIRTVQREEFEKFLLLTVKQKLTNFKQKEPMHERSRPIQKVIEFFADIAGCIWNGLLMHNSENDDGSIEASSDVIELRLTMVNEIVTLLCSSYSSISGYLIKEFSDDDSDASYDAVFPKFFSSWKAVHGWIPVASNSDDDNEKPVHQHLFDILNAFAKPLSPDSEGNNNTGEVLNWIWNYMSTSSGKSGKAEFLLAESAVSCWLTFYMKGRDFLEQPGKRHHDVLTLAIGVKQVLGIGDEVDSQHLEDAVKVKMWIINEDTAPTIFCTIMNHVELILDHISTVVAKLKFNRNDDSETQNKIGLLRGVCFTKIEEIVSVCSQLVVCRFPAGLCSTTVLKTISQIFAVMTGFGEYLFELMKTKRPFSFKGFANPVAKIGSHFKPLVDAMIQHLERVQRELANDICEKAVANKKKNLKKQITARAPQAVKNQFCKERKVIPNFVYTVEKYDQQIIELSKKNNKIKLIVGMKLSTSRDFKINSTIFTDAVNSDVRTVQEITTVPDEESNAELVNNSTAGRRARMGRKRKTTEEVEEVDNDVE